jgi:putative acetyltransferase
MLSIKRTHSSDTDFIDLVNQLDQELAVIDGEDHAFYSQYNKIDRIQHAIVAYKDSQAIGCGALKALDKGQLEVKRMFVHTSGSNMGTATQILSALEKWGLELGYTSCILETGKRQKDAIALYTKNGYTVIPNYGPYAGVENSICFDKKLK